MDLGRPWVLRGAAVALALVVGAIAWVASESGEEASAPAQPLTRIVGGEGELAALAASAGHPVYWLGPPVAGRLEATELPEGGVQVRYLEEDEGPGDSLAERVAVGSYPLADPGAAVEAVARRPGAVERRVPGVGTVVASPREGTSLYFADPSNTVQVEVYAPSVARALGLVRSGRLEPIG